MLINGTPKKVLCDETKLVLKSESSVNFSTIFEELSLEFLLLFVCCIEKIINKIEEIELLDVAGDNYDHDKVLNGDLTPVFFGSALTNFGVEPFLESFLEISEGPQARESNHGAIDPTQENFPGFVFKIQANMDPQHRDRIAFLRICSGEYRKGMKMKHVRLGKDLRVSDAVTFMAGDRENADLAYAGDIIGLHNHGTIQIGDTFTEGEQLKFSGIPNFAPELFRLIRLKGKDEIASVTKVLEKDEGEATDAGEEGGEGVENVEGTSTEGTETNPEEGEGEGGGGEEGEGGRLQGLPANWYAGATRIIGNRAT